MMISQWICVCPMNGVNLWWQRNYSRALTIPTTPRKNLVAWEAHGKPMGMVRWLIIYWRKHEGTILTPWRSIVAIELKLALPKLPWIGGDQLAMWSWELKVKRATYFAPHQNRNMLTVRVVNILGLKLPIKLSCHICNSIFLTVIGWRLEVFWPGLGVCPYIF